jgi:dimethylargininase
MTGTLLVRPPPSRFAEGQVTHIERSEVSHAAALAQWKGYVDAYRARGWNVIEVELAEDCPDSVFIEDTVIMFGNVAVIASLGHVSRVPEPVAVEKVLREQLPNVTIKRIEAPGTLDGGDVLKVGKDVYVGRGGRTNAAGISQLRTIVSQHGYTLHPVPVSKALHLSEQQR